MEDWDVIVIGAGIAGASIAYELAAERKVLLLEREDQPGYHTTGRSAASFSEVLGAPTVRALSVGSRSFFENPPEGFSEAPLWTEQDVLLIGGAEQEERVEERHRSLRGLSAEIELLDAASVRNRVPVLRQGAVKRAIREPAARALDVHAILQGYLRGLRARGGRLVTDAEVLRIARKGSLWRIDTKAGQFGVNALLNAAGAWADQVAGLAAVAPQGLTPLRRTAFTFAPPPGTDVQGWPMTVDIDERFYFRPDAGLLLGSLCDETPSPPCDAQPEEEDLAKGVARIEDVLNFKISSVRRKWAGLRTFAPGRQPVFGADPVAKGFFWFAGQGGTGIQTAPAAARLGAALVLGRGVPDDLAALGVRAEDVAPHLSG